jgi:FixJ family two-component response regulator
MPAPGQTSEATVPTVFIVDDDVNVRGALARLLRSLRMQVETFASAHEFQRCSRPAGPACLVLDVRLAGENGLLVQEALQSTAWCPPIIFLTGHGTVPMCVRAMKAGAIDFLQKPVDEEDLLAAIASALAQDDRRRDSQHRHAVLSQRVATLTPRERDVLGLLTTGLRNKEIAYALGTSERTIKAHRGSLMRKMQVTSVAELVHLVTMVEQEAPPRATMPGHSC